MRVRVYLDYASPVIISDKKVMCLVVLVSLFACQLATSVKKLSLIFHVHFTQQKAVSVHSIPWDNPWSEIKHGQIQYLHCY